MDFNKLKVATKVNSKKVSKTSSKAKISLPIRKESEVEKPKPVMKNFNITMYKKSYQFCDKCDTETVHILKEDMNTCIYCNSSYKVFFHNQYKVIPIIYVHQNDLIFL